jgi:glucosamine--fructose-6-phosphate aminotransferase (isomerizing)
LFIAISQSGRSPDILISAQSARDAGALVVAIVNDADSPLAHIAEVTIPMLAGPERGVAATKSFIATLLAILNLVAVWTDQEDLRLACSAAPPALREAWKLDWSAAVDTLTGANSLFVIGRGLTFGIAQEAALKLKETCGLHAEAYSAAEVRHGPMALVGPGFPLLMFTPIDESGKDFGALAQELVDLGARIIMTGEEAQDAVPVPLPPGLHPALVPIAAVQSFYRFAASLSLARGLDPDRPPHLRKVTRTR